MNLPAKLISSDVVSLLKRTAAEGKIFSIFDHACNIELEKNQIVTLITPRLINFPSTIKLNIIPNNNLKTIGLTVGMEAVLNREVIKFKKSPLTIDLTQAEVWDSSPMFIKSTISEKMLKSSLKRIRELTLDYGNMDGLATVLNKNSKNNFVTFISPSIERLVLGLKQQNQNLIKEASKRLIGFGPGLTPAADDLILGIMASLYYIGNFYGNSFNLIKEIISSIVYDISGRTTLISETMLKNGANGLFHEPLRELMQAVILGDEVTDKCMSLLNIGATSGADCAAGVVIGGLLMNDIKVMKEVGNDDKIFDKGKYLL